MSRLQTPRKAQKLGDRFAGVWEDERSADEIITPILHPKAQTATQLVSTTEGKSGFGFYVCKI